MKSVLEKTRLPEGFRDFGPAGAQAITNMSGRLDRLYSRWGYRRVLTPSIEAEDVIGPALGPKAAARAFRLVDPLTGQVLVYRPDITPQVARLVATGAAGAAPPIKLFYRGQVVRRRAEASSGAREIFQSGVENFGAESRLADAETVALAAEAVSEAGVAGAVLELGDVRFVEGVLSTLKIDAEMRADLTGAIDRKARAEIEAFLKIGKAPRAARKILERLPDLFGGTDVLAAAKKLELPPLSRRAVANLEALVKTLGRAGCAAAELNIDLAEVRGLDYYTGLLFAIYASGAPTPLLRGGRYDNLAAKFGRNLPAVGFAADLELLSRLGSVARAHGDLADADVVLYDDKGRIEQALAEAARLRGEGRRVALVGVNVSRAQATAFAEEIGTKPTALGGRALAVSKKKKARNKR